MRRLVGGAVLLAVLLLSSPCWAQISDEGLREANKLVQQTLYSRIDIPCHYFKTRVAHTASVTWVEPMVEISASGVRAHSAEPGYLPADVFWRIRPNDPVRYGKAYRHWGGIDISVEGLPPNQYEVVLRFPDVTTIQAFQAALDLAFSRVPLQDAHPEWPADIRQAVADRRVIRGMTIEQAYCVLGRPARTEKNGNAETWYPRQAVFHSADRTEMIPSGFPRSVKFVDGQVSEIGEPADLEPLPQYPKDFLDQVKKMLDAKLYLRIHVPCQLSPEWRPVVEVSPEGVCLPGVLSGPLALELDWDYLPNVEVHPKDVRQSGGTLEIRDGYFTMWFVGIKTMDDFKAAFDRAFSRVRLQDEHPEWPAAVRAAIANRCVVPGMTSAQLRSVLGEALRFETRDENGTNVGDWYSRDPVVVCADREHQTPQRGLSRVLPLKLVNDELVLAGKVPGIRPE